MPPILAIVGRPNVGKSSLFNRLARRSAALTHDLPGVTRDRVMADAMIGDLPVRLVDTGGLTLDVGKRSEEFEDEVFEQAREAVAGAHGVLLVMDGRAGLTPVDKEVADFVRKSGKPVILGINKVDGPGMEDRALAEFHGLGFEPMGISASHGHNIQDLRERVEELLLPFAGEDDDPDVEKGLRLAMLGKPNAGKSSIINKLSGVSRLIVSPKAGTTRDSLDVAFERAGRLYTVVDTAGVRRRTRIEDPLERFSVLRALKSSRKADVTVLVMDALEGVTRQDKRLIALMDKEKTPFLAVVNKMDLVEKKRARDLKQDFRDALRICPHVPLVHTSAITGGGLQNILPLAEKIHAECSRRISTGKLNRAMEAVLEKHQAPVIKGRRAKFYYLTQADIRPPTFIFFVNDPKRVMDSYARYLENGLRKLFGIENAPIRVLFRESKGKKPF